MTMMTPEQALRLVAQGCASVQADLATHQQLQAALHVLEVAITPVEEPAAEEPPAPEAEPVDVTANGHDLDAAVAS